MHWATATASCPALTLWPTQGTPKPTGGDRIYNPPQTGDFPQNQDGLAKFWNIPANLWPLILAAIQDKNNNHLQCLRVLKPVSSSSSWKKGWISSLHTRQAADASNCWVSVQLWKISYWSVPLALQHSRHRIWTSRSHQCSLNPPSEKRRGKSQFKTTCCVDTHKCKQGRSSRHEQSQGCHIKSSSALILTPLRLKIINSSMLFKKISANK